MSALIYVASPLRAPEPWGIQRNLVFARMALAHAIAMTPSSVAIAPHLLFPQVLDATDPDQDARGIQLAMGLLANANELHLYLPRPGRLSTGMEAEVHFWLSREDRSPARRAWVLRPEIPAEYLEPDGIYPSPFFDAQTKRPTLSGLRAGLSGVMSCPIEEAFVPAALAIHPSAVGEKNTFSVEYAPKQGNA